MEDTDELKAKPGEKKRQNTTEPETPTKKHKTSVHRVDPFASKQHSAAPVDPPATSKPDDTSTPNLKPEPTPKPQRTRTPSKNGPRRPLPALKPPQEFQAALDNAKKVQEKANGPVIQDVQRRLDLHTEQLQQLADTLSAAHNSIQDIARRLDELQERVNDPHADVKDIPPDHQARDAAKKASKDISELRDDVGKDFDELRDDVLNLRRATGFRYLDDTFDLNELAAEGDERDKNDESHNDDAADGTEHNEVGHDGDGTGAAE